MKYAYIVGVIAFIYLFLDNGYKVIRSFVSPEAIAQDLNTYRVIRLLYSMAFLLFGIYFFNQIKKLRSDNSN